MCLPTVLPRIVLLAALLAPCIAAGARERPSTRAATEAIGASTNAVLQGDASDAVAALQRVPAAQFSAADADHRACMAGRFQRTAPPDLAGPRSGSHRPRRTGCGCLRPCGLQAYQHYWWHALVAPGQRDAQAGQLLHTLRGLLGVPATGAKDLDAIDALLGRALEARGLHSVRGETSPLRELMVWRTQDVRQQAVAMPDGRVQTVRLVLMDHFVSRGWGHYGSCGRSGAGGWATEEAIQAVVPAYDLHSDKFRASLLTHEAQHFSDKTRFPGLADWELEYRAKLAELWAANETRPELLRKFGLSQSDDLRSPHTYATNAC